MEFRLFGPVDLRVGGRPVELGPAKQRCVLAVLLSQPGVRVSTEALIDKVWGADPPAEVRATLHSYVSRLRRVLRVAGVALLRNGTGYILDVPPDWVDLSVFSRRVAAARSLRPADRMRLLRMALDCWRGEPLEGISGTWAEGVRQRAHDDHVAALTGWATAALAAGDPAEVVPRLGAALDRYPLAEPLVAAFLLALRQAGRTAEALEHYEAIRVRLRDKLGTRPGPALRAAHFALLGEQADPAQVRTPPPAQLPAAPSGFAGRTEHLYELGTVLDEPADPLSPTIVMISGTGGVGKTALAVTWAHTVAGRYPDGQLHIDLGGYGPGEPRRPIDALAVFLRALGVAPEEIPLTEEPAAALYRSLLANRRMLILADNATSTSQVRPLLPGNRDSLLVITSRDRLGELVATTGAHRLPLGPLTPPEAVDALALLAGTDRVAADPSGARELTELCGRFPLAIRIAAANLVDCPDRRLRDYAAELRTRDRLTLATTDASVAVRTAFDQSYQRLPEEQRRVFRRLGTHPGPDFTAETAGVLAATSATRARKALRALVTASLVEPRPHGRYALPDLLHGYAAERARTDERVGP